MSGRLRIKQKQPDLLLQWGYIHVGFYFIQSYDLKLKICMLNLTKRENFGAETCFSPVLGGKLLCKTSRFRVNLA